MKCGYPYCACVGQCFAQSSPLTEGQPMTEIKSWKDRIDYTEPPMIMRMSKAKDEEIADLRAELAKSQPVRPMSDAEIQRIAAMAWPELPAHWWKQQDGAVWLSVSKFARAIEAHIKGATE